MEEVCLKNNWKLQHFYCILADMKTKRWQYLAIYLCLVLLIFTCFSCKSLSQEGRHFSQAKKQIKVYAYADAISSLAMAIHIDPAYEKAILLLVETFPKALAWYTAEITVSSGRSDIDSLDKAAKAYGAFVSIDSSVKLISGVLNPKTGMSLRLSVPDYRSEYFSAAELAAEAHYNRGINYLNQGGRDQAKLAVSDFLAVLAYFSDYRDARALELKARQIATIKLAVMPFSMSFTRFSGYDMSRKFQQEIIEEIRDDRSLMEFTSLIEPSVIDDIIWRRGVSNSRIFDDNIALMLAADLSANFIIAGNIRQFYPVGPTVYNSVVERTATIKATTDDVTKGLAKEVGESIEVKARYTFHRLYAGAEIRIIFKVLDADNRKSVYSYNLTEKQEDEKEWGENLEGDRRALTQNDITLINRSAGIIKSVTTLVDQAVEELSQDIFNRAKSYLR